MTKSSISLTQMRKQSQKLPFNPKVPGPMKVVTQMQDRKYWTQRAAELLLSSTEDDFEDDLRMAAKLILVTLCHLDNAITDEVGPEDGP